MTYPADLPAGISCNLAVTESQIDSKTDKANDTDPIQQPHSRKRINSVHSVEETALEILRQGISRRHFLQTSAAAAATLISPRLSASASHRVGVGNRPDPYLATQVAIAASGEWPPVDGKVVIIKPNLVVGDTAETGKVTDPEVVRAVVDLALQDGALLVLIVETAPSGAHFIESGYHIFHNYDAENRVYLVDLHDLNLVLAPNPAGWIYKQIYMANLLRFPNAVFVYVAKLKTHSESTVTLTAKNLFGLPDLTHYISPRFSSGRFAMHDRGVSQAIVDLNILRPSHFSIIDGIWGMEGAGPIRGTPVFTGTVLAGRNSLAVDRVGLELMGVPQNAVRHLSYLSMLALGPSRLNQIDVLGDSLVPVDFVLPTLPPEFNPPVVSPRQLDSAAGERVSINVWFYSQCVRKIEIVRVYDDRADVERVRELQPYGLRISGQDRLSWDGRGDDGNRVEPVTYAVRVTAYNQTLIPPRRSDQLDRRRLRRSAGGGRRPHDAQYAQSSTCGAVTVVYIDHHQPGGTTRQRRSERRPALLCCPVSGRNAILPASGRRSVATQHRQTP